MAEQQAGAAGARWAGLSEAAAQDLAEWPRAHPQATLAELEAAVEQRLDALRGHLLGEAAARAAALAGAGETDAPVCAWCAAPLGPRDTPTRTVRIRGNAHLRLTRPYLTCTACGYGVFPPG